MNSGSEGLMTPVSRMRPARSPLRATGPGRSCSAARRGGPHPRGGRYCRSGMDAAARFEGDSPMNTLLWILAFVLGAVFVASGAAKLLAPREQQIERTPYVQDFPQQIIRGIEVLEIPGAFGLLLPPLLGIAPLLASVAAA